MSEDTKKKAKRKRPSKAEIEERRALVAALTNEGKTVREITDLLPERFAASKSTVQRDREAISEEWRIKYTDKVDDFVMLTLARLEEALLAVWPKVKRGDGTAVNSMIKIMERQAKLLGLDEGIDLNLNINGQATVTNLFGIDPAVLATLDEDEIDRLIENFQIAAIGLPDGEEQAFIGSEEAIEGEYTA